MRKAERQDQQQEPEVLARALIGAHADIQEHGITSQLSALSSIAEDLNRESDSINDLLSQYEAKIRALNVGIEVSVVFKHSAYHDGWNDPEHASGSLHWKILQHYDSTTQDMKRWWGLAVNDKNVLACSREERIAALNHIPNLVAKLTAEAQARVDVIRKAKDLLK